MLRSPFPPHFLDLQYAGKLEAGNFELYKAIAEDHEIMAWKEAESKKQSKKARKQSKEEIYKRYWWIERLHMRSFGMVAGFEKRLEAILRECECPHLRMKKGKGK